VSGERESLAQFEATFSYINLQGTGKFMSTLSKPMSCDDLAIRSLSRVKQRRVVEMLLCGTLSFVFAFASTSALTASAQDTEAQPGSEAQPAAPPPSQAAAEPAAPAAAPSRAIVPGGLKDSSPQDRPQMLSFLTGLHYGHFAFWGFPLTIGARYYIPLVHDGFIRPVNDEFGIEFGADFDITFLSSIYADSVLFGFGIPVDVMWDFHFTPRFDLYVKLGVVMGAAFADTAYDYGGFWWAHREIVGLRLKIGESMCFRAEAGWPTLLVGFGFAL
jgi:hypothetical protein